MKKLSLLEIKELFEKFGFTKFALIKIINNIDFNSKGYMDWLLGQTLIIAYYKDMENFTPTSIEIPKISARNYNSILKYCPLVCTECKNLTILPIIRIEEYVYRINQFNKLISYLVNRFGEYIPDIYDFHEKVWYLQTANYKIIKDPFNIDNFFKKNNFRKIIRKKF